MDRLSIFWAVSITALLFLCCSCDDSSFVTQTTVDKSKDSPTGYYVTFRLDAPDADRVRVQGEWMFSDPSEATMITGTEATPYEWENGYVIWTSVSIFSNGGLPVFDLEKNAETGIWELQMPLPSGTFKYKLYTGGVGDDVSNLRNAVEVPDPANPPYHRDTSTGRLTGEDTYCFVYVPYDPVKQSLCDDRSIEAPRKDKKGTVCFDIIQSSIDTTRSIKTGVYLPYGFDSLRSEKYPLLVVYHGGGGCESSWFNNGLANILDNMIAEGRMEPTVVLTPNASDFRWMREVIDNELGSTVIPYAITKYNVDESVERRAMAGLSMGGATVMYTVINHPELFSKYLSMSAPYTSDITKEYDPMAKDVTIVITAGQYDFVKVDGMLDPVNKMRYRGFEGSVYQYMYDMRDNGIKFYTRPEQPYGHAWVLWRDDLVYFIENFIN